MKLAAAFIASLLLVAARAAALSGSTSSRQSRGCTDVYETDAGARICLRISDVSFDCREEFAPIAADGVGFESCTVGARYEIQVDSVSAAAASVSLVCDATVLYQTARNHIFLLSDSGGRTMEVSLSVQEDAGDVTVDISLMAIATFTSKVVMAKLDGFGCRLGDMASYETRDGPR